MARDEVVCVADYNTCHGGVSRCGRCQAERDLFFFDAPPLATRRGIHAWTGRCRQAKRSPRACDNLGAETLPPGRRDARDHEEWGRRGQGQARPAPRGRGPKTPTDAPLGRISAGRSIWRRHCLSSTIGRAIMRQESFVDGAQNLPGWASSRHPARPDEDPTGGFQVRRRGRVPSSPKGSTAHRPRAARQGPRRCHSASFMVARSWLRRAARSTST
jgi:hypothetical protein